jgi:hypothetical protein
MLGVIRELRRAILPIRHADKIACRVVGIGHRLVVLRNAPVGIAREHDSQTRRMRDAIRREA